MYDLAVLVVNSLFRFHIISYVVTQLSFFDPENEIFDIMTWVGVLYVLKVYSTSAPVSMMVLRF